MPTTLQSVSDQINGCMGADRARLRARIRGLRRRSDRGLPVDKGLKRLNEDIRRSVEKRAKRAAAMPAVSYPDDLPIAARRAEIADAIRENQLVVVCGDTGSGKSTQLPKICLELGRGVDGYIGHTQPRRLAARSVAARVAEELGTELGGQIGYKVRFGDETSADTLVKVMTDGVLLAETQGDRALDQYDTLIIDEAHERSLNIDFLLGYLHRLLPKRPDLKVIITSATIDPQRFAKHFRTPSGREAPIIEVSGRTYPVDVLYRPLATDDPDEEDRTLQEAVVHAVDELASLDRSGDEGDILIFMPGEREIRETAESLGKHHVPRSTHTEIAPLYARLSPKDQQRVFQPHRGRRIVIATNVAETSLTVPGIRYVIDPGLARISRYSTRTKVQRLPIEPVSRASADQRKGRCGRIEPGVCIRLYDEEDYEQRSRFTDPEILRTNLASVILQMKALRLGEPEEFPFIEPPDARAFRDGYETLLELGAMEQGGDLTKTGDRIARLPIDPRIARMILAAHEENALDEALVIAAALSTQDPRVRPSEQANEADAAHEQFRDDRSDFISILNLWNFFREQSRKLSGGKLRKLCKQNFLAYMRMREWIDVHRQLRELVTEMGMKPSGKEADYAPIHRALLAGLLSSVGALKSEHEYAGAHGVRFNIFPGSGLFARRPKWIMAAELVRTTKLYARTVAQIDPAWIEQVGAHLVKRTHADPQWDAETARVMANERVTLYGLDIIPRRRVQFGAIDPEQSRAIFIHHALVEGEFTTKGEFFAHNQNLLDSVEKYEAKARRRGLIADHHARFDFYDKRIPAGVYSGRTFETWRREAEKTDPKRLYMNEQDLVADDVSNITPERYPDEIDAGAGARLRLDYRLAPGESDDGVTIDTPIEALPAIDNRVCGWLTPGLLEEKVEALIRSLPKEHRRLFVPAPDFAKKCAAALQFGRGDLQGAVAEQLGRMSGVRIPVELFRLDTIPDHLRMNVRVLDEQGRTIDMDRDLDSLRERLRPELERRLSDLDDAGWSREGVTEWSFGDLPEAVTIDRAGFTITAHPAVLDRGDSVALRLLPSRDAAVRATHHGVRRLFAIECARELKRQVRTVDGLDAMSVNYASLGTRRDLERDLALLIADRAFLPDGDPPRSREAFMERVDEGWNRLMPATNQASALAQRILEEHHATRVLLERSWPESCAPAITDIDTQLRGLVFPGFLTQTPFAWLYQFPRYLAASRRRLERLQGGAHKRDAQLMAEVTPRLRLYRERAARHEREGVYDPALEQARWMLEELRVHLFAPDLGVAMPISPAKFDAHWQRVRP